MKHAILITAHKEIKHLIKLIHCFDNDFYIYIHLDKKSRISKDEIDIIQNAENVVFFSRHFKVNWAGRNYLKCILLLSEEAVKNRDVDYFHLISGQDFLIKNHDTIHSLLTKNKGKEFLGFFELPAKRWSGDGGMDRICYFNFFDVFNAKIFIGRAAINSLLKVQRIFKVKRRIQPNLPKLFGGSGYWTLSYPCLKYVIDYTKNNPYLLKRLKHSFCAEEIYFQTVIMNSPFKVNVANDDLRYIEWKHKNGSRPAILDETDYDNIINSNAIFSRKCQHPHSEKLLKKIEEHITNHCT